MNSFVLPIFAGTLGVAFFAVSLSILSLAFIIWMLIDCIGREEKDFKDKTLWTVLLAVGLLMGYSLILSVIYYFVVKKKLDN